MNVSSAPDADAYPFVSERGAASRISSRATGSRRWTERISCGSSAVRFYDRATRAARERGFASVRASRGGTPFEMRLVLTPVPWWWVQMLCAALAFLVGLLLLVRAPEWHLARRNFVVFFCLGALSASFDWKTSGIRARGSR